MLIITGKPLNPESDIYTRGLESGTFLIAHMWAPGSPFVGKTLGK